MNAPAPPLRVPAQPWLRPGVRLGVYPQRMLRPEDRLERSLERFVLPLRLPRAANKKHWPEFLRGVHTYDAKVRKLSDEDIEKWFRGLRLRLAREHLTFDNTIAAMATVRDVAGRLLGVRHHDEQLIGGWVMLEGMLAEMATGEGKTLTATLSACTAALAGIPVHVVTVNDYLARRDAALMAPIYKRLGLSVGVIAGDMTTAQRRAAYTADVTYCTNSQLVFDYLRDRLTLGNGADDLRLRLRPLIAGKTGEPLLLRGLYFAIVDEADSIFVDEARTPLILAGPASGPGLTPYYERALWLAAQLHEGTDFAVEDAARRIVLTDAGQRRAAEIAAPFDGAWADARKREALIGQALTARRLYKPDQHYIVRAGRVEIVDEHTGRAMPDRSWEQGLHQMIEIKEGLPPSAQSQPLARISYQRFFQRYLKLAGMSGTVREARAELRSVYGLHCVTVPRHRPSRLTRRGAYYFRRAADKWLAIVRAITHAHRAKRAVLVGTRTIADSEKLSAWLSEAGVAHQVLNARQDADEAAIIARAGESGRVTIATNMAGRGTDIPLVPAVEAAGGLHVILCEHNESRRVDRQLIGRCARQGDPGSYEIFGSLEDDVIRLRAGSWPAKALKKAVLPRWLGTAGVWLAQQLTELRNRRARRVLVRHDEEQEARMGFSGQSE